MHRNDLGKAVIFIAIFTLIFIPLWTDKYIFNKIIYSGRDSIIFEIPKSSSLLQISAILQQKGFDISEMELKLTAKWLEKDNKIRYGRFVYVPSSNHTRLNSFIDFLTRNGTVTSNITIPEGSRIIDIAGILKADMNIDSIAFAEAAYDSLILKKYNIPARSMEGYLYPETYNFNRSDNIGDIIDKMYKMNRIRLDEIREKFIDSKYDEHQILTLASIIQGEVMDLGEINSISAVYNNRLKKGMLLQADPTIQYLFNKPKRLLNKDIAIDSPYNTYLYKGLPPGPINNPSQKAVAAALEPSDEPYIYMVAKGDGTHSFNTNLEDHLSDKAKLDKLRKKHKYKK